MVWDVLWNMRRLIIQKKGLQSFTKSIHDESYLSKLCMYGAFMGKQVGWRYCDAKRGRAHRSVFCKR